MPMSPITVVTVTQKNQLGTEELNRDQEELLDHVSLTGKLHIVINDILYLV